MTIFLNSDGSHRRDTLAVLSNLCVMFRHAAFAGFLYSSFKGNDEGAPEDPFSRYLFDSLFPPGNAETAAKHFGELERVAIALALDDLVEARASRWFNPSHQWPKDISRWFKQRVLRHLKEGDIARDMLPTESTKKRLQKRKENAWTPDVSKDAAAHHAWERVDDKDGNAPKLLNSADTFLETVRPADPRRVGQMLQSDPRWDNLTRCLSPSEKAAAQKALAAYRLGYSPHNRRGMNLAASLTSSELKAWRRARSREPKLQRMMAGLWKNRRQTWPRPRLRGIEPIYRHFIIKSPEHQTGFTELLSYSGSERSERDRPQEPGDKARAWMLARIAHCTEFQLLRQLELPFNVAGFRALCLFYLDLYVFAYLFKLPTLAAYKAVADRIPNTAQPEL